MERIKVRNKEQLLKLYDLLDGVNYFSWDTEATSIKYSDLEITGFSLANDNIALYIYIDSSTNNNREEAVSKEDFKDFITKLFGDCKNVYNVAHNWVFDAKVISKEFGLPIENSKPFDTMIAYHLINENDKKSLKYLTRKLLDREVTEFEEVGDNHYTEEFGDYGLDDAVNTWDLHKMFRKKLKEESLEYLFYKIEMPYQKVLLEMTITGVDVDIKLRDKTLKLLQEELLELTNKLCNITNSNYEIEFDLFGNVNNIITSINFNSSRQLIELFNKRGLEITEVTPSGAPSVGKKTIDKFRKKDEFVRLLYLYKNVQKLLSGFFLPLPSHLESDGKVRPNFKDHGTKTGRLSCSNPNLQQLPKPKCESCGSKDIKGGVCRECNNENKVNLRSCFKAPEGYKMFSVDYSGQEVAVMAQQSKDPTLVTSLNNGYDMHLAVANKFYNLGIPEECLNKSHPDFEKYKDKYSLQRSNAKTITFGLAYGKGSFGFSQDFGISEEDAQKLVDDYFSGMKKLKSTIDATHKFIKYNGFIINLAGRKRHFVKNDKGFYDSKAYRQSFNFLIQSFSADMIRAASINVYARKREHPEWCLRQVMTVHDENVYIVKEEFVEEATVMVKKAFEDVCKKFLVPVIADVEVGDNYGNAK